MMKYGIAINGKFVIIGGDERQVRRTVALCMPQFSVDMIKTYSDDEIEQGHDGNGYEKGHAPQKPVEEARAEKLAELNAAFEMASREAHCFSSLGFEIDADEVANRNIEGLILVLKEGESTLFRAYDNTFHEVSREQLETMRREIVMNSQKRYRLKWEREAAIESAETAEELDAMAIAFESASEATPQPDA